MIFPGVPAKSLAAMALAGFCSPLLAQSDFVMEGHAGFVVSHIEYALGLDADEAGSCPEGLTVGYQSPADMYVGDTGLVREEGELEDDFRRRVAAAVRGNPDIKNLCHYPELGSPDPKYRTVTGDHVPAYGINMTGHVARRDGPAAPGTCAYDSFVGMNGEQGIDNQYYRVVGCGHSYQSTGQSNTFAVEMLTGSWGILITLDQVDDIVNDDYVEVGFYANADPIQLSPSREPLEFSTYAVDQDTRYHARATGRIVDGVLTTDPVDMRFHWVVNSMVVDRPLRDARVQMTLGEDGVMEGYLAGYTPLEEMYDMNYGYRNARVSNGDLAPLQLRTGSALGKARVLGYTCEGVYQALYEHADGHPDPETGQCTSISTQYKISAIPAFVVDVPTSSSNEDLKQSVRHRY